MLEPVLPERNLLRGANVIRTVSIALATFYALKLMGLSVSVLLAGFLGILFGLNLSALADVLQRRRIPRAVTAGGSVIVLFGALAATAVLLGPTLREQGSVLRKQLPNAIDRIDSRLQQMGVSFPLPKSTSDDSTRVDTTRTSIARPADSTSHLSSEAPQPMQSGNLRAQLASRFGDMSMMAGSLLSAAATALAGVFVVVFVAIFYAIEPRVYRNGLLHLVPHSHRERIGNAMSAAGIVLRRWLSAQFLAMLIIGVLSTVAYLLIGLKAPIALGIIAGVCEFVPFVGPIAAAVPAIGMALAVSPEKALYVIAASLIIQQSEEVLIVPLLMKNNLTLPPILTILAQGVMGLAFGIMGLLVAVPMLAATMVAVKMLYVQNIVGDDMCIDANGPQNVKGR